MSDGLLLLSYAFSMNSTELNAERRKPFRVGVLRGEGIGPELIDAALRVLEGVAENRGLKFQIETGGEIGSLSARRNGEYLSGEVIEFCCKIFDVGGAILAGAAGGRFVYDMRRRFNLYYKLNPLRSYQELRDACRIKLPVKPINVLLVRENLQGIYQGDSVENSSEDGREVSHTFVHNEKQVRAVLEVAAAVARSRRNLLTVVGKNSGAPAVHALWGACAMEVSQAAGVEFSMLDIDYAAYKLLQDPESFDVIAAPNCFGDILSDLGGVLAGSRGLTFGASYSAKGAAVYQTNHGAAYDIAGSDMANPIGQIFSVAMMLRETFGLRTEAQLIENSVRGVWRNGWRTAELAEPGCKIAGTRQFGELVAEEIRNAAIQDEACSAIG